MASEFPLLGEPLAVDLANTLIAEDDHLVDLLPDETALGIWLGLQRHRLPVDALAAPPALEEVHALREVVRELLGASLEAQRPAKKALDSVNRCLRGAPTAELAWRDRRYHQRSRPSDSSGAALLAAVARSAMETLTGEDADRLRRCDGRGCVLVFVARHSHRQYCSPRLCGTRERVARHRERARFGG